MLLLALAALAGCASMPSSGPVQPVDSSRRADGDSQVRVFGVSPEEGALPHEIVRGFLEAVTSDEAQFDTAREYLTPERRRDWNPFAGTTVLASGPSLAPPVTRATPDGGGETVVVEVTGTQLAAVDAAHVYTPVEADYRATFELRQVRQEWRIDVLPDGLIMGQADFQRNYRSVDAYYFADLGPEAGRLADDGENVLVADPIYVRRRINPLTEVVASLLAGPSAWLDPVVSTAFPQGVGLARGSGPTVEDDGTLTVRLTGVPRDWPKTRCERMGAQLLHSVRELSTVEVTEVRIANQAGTQLCGLPMSRAQAYAPGRLDGDLGQPYFVDDAGRLVSVSQHDGIEAQPVSGPLGRGEVRLGEAAVSRTAEWAAGVSEDGTSLYVAPLSGGEELSEPVYQRPSRGGDDAGLTAPSWDGLGDLWVADRDPEGQRLLRLPSGSGAVQEVAVDGLREGQRIEALRVASDGVRIAMLVSDEEHTTLQLGRVERSGGVGKAGARTRVVVDGLRAVAPQLENVAAASWAGRSTLVVAGRPVDGVEQWQFVSTDGSLKVTPTVPGLNDVTGVAAAENESRPLLAETADGIAMLADDAQWRLIPTGHSSGPFYPG